MNWTTKRRKPPPRPSLPEKPETWLTLLLCSILLCGTLDILSMRYSSVAGSTKPAALSPFLTIFVPPSERQSLILKYVEIVGNRERGADCVASPSDKIVRPPSFLNRPQLRRPLPCSFSQFLSVLPRSVEIDVVYVDVARHVCCLLRRLNTHAVSGVHVRGKSRWHGPRAGR